MNETMNVILSRRSTRKFTAEPISDEIMQQLVEAALHAPSGMGKKTWTFIAITDRRVIQSLAGAIGKELGRAEYNMYDPTALIIPTNQKDSPFGMEDNACALQNVFLAAESFGVGSVWINQLRSICDAPAIRPILRELGVPDDHVVYGMAALGYPAEGGTRPYRPCGEVRYIK